MAKKKNFARTKPVKPIPVKYDRKIPSSDEEAAHKFKVGFWKHKHKPANKKRVDHHPAYVYSRNGQYYRYLGITKDAKSGHHNNDPLTKNPDSLSSDKAYLRRADQDHYRNFTKYYPNWRFDDDDYRDIVKKAKK